MRAQYEPSRELPPELVMLLAHVLMSGNLSPSAAATLLGDIGRDATC